MTPLLHRVVQSIECFYEHVAAEGGLILVDCTNPIKSDFSDLESGPSAAKRIQAWLPRAHVVKCFNQTGFENMDKPE